VRIWISDAARTTPGALVIFWHGLGGQAANAALALAGLGPDVVADILAKGGIVAAPEKSEKRTTVSVSELPWLLALGAGEEDDLFVMDEIVGCAIQELNIDTRRIHTTGMSAGGLQTGQVAARRSGYLASVVPFSGGQLGSPPIQDPNNKYAAALFHGGDGDMVVINFKQQQTAFHDRLKSQGQFAILCDHGEGHRVVAAAATGGWAFMQDHPYGVTPEPYADGLPDTIPDYCVP
jgi:poly(3-hydroxybutyrate) depolymerase